LAVRKLRRGLITQRTVRPLRVIVEAPLFNDNPRLPQAAKDFPVQTFVPQLVVETLDVSVLPRRARRDVDRLDVLILQPVLDRVSDELWTVVAAQVQRRPIT